MANYVDLKEIKKSTGRPRILNPSATRRLMALMAEQNLKIEA